MATETETENGISGIEVTTDDIVLGRVQDADSIRDFLVARGIESFRKETGFIPEKTDAAKPRIWFHRDYLDAVLVGSWGCGVLIVGDARKTINIHRIHENVYRFIENKNWISYQKEWMKWRVLNLKQDAK